MGVLSAIAQRVRPARRRLASVALVIVAIAGLLVLLLAFLRQRSQIAAWESATPSQREGSLAARPHARTDTSMATANPRDLDATLGGSTLCSDARCIRGTMASTRLLR